MQSHIVETDNLPLHVLEKGEGPLVLLVHGFPDLAIGWHHQIEALARAGYHVVAPDMRGYGRTGGPDEVEAYAITELVGDLVALVAALGQDQAVIVGHDWGSAVSWHAALLRPDIFKAVMGMAVPFQPRRGKGPPTKVMRYLAQKNGEDEIYLAAFLSDMAHLIMDADPQTALRKMFWSFDGATSDTDQATGRIPRGQNFISVIPDRATLPPWMSPAHFAAYVATFEETGFERAVHWYRNIDANWAQTRWLQGCKITVPSAFLVGERDPVRRYAGHHEAELQDWLTDLRGMTIVPEAGHWVQQEKPEAVNEAILDFLSALAV